VDGRRKLPRKISHKSLQQELRSFEATFDKCLEIVLQFKDGSFEAEGLNAFQFRLYEALLKLSRFHQGLHEERRALLGRRTKLSRATYERRQEQLEQRRRIVVNAIAAGRSLGDAFLWFFYRAEPELMRQHRAQPAPSLPPPFDGGEGELALVGGVRFLANNFILFHGITTLFRLGDASLVDLATQRIVGIGELKTTRVDSRQLDLRFVASFNPDAVLPDSKATADTQQNFEPLDEKRQARLDKQLARISRAAAAASQPPYAKLELRAGEMAHAKELSDLVNEARPGRPALRQFSPGLLVAAVASQRRTMRGRLMTQRAPELPLNWEELPALTKRLMLTGSTQNCLILGSVFYQDEWQSFLEAGATPLLLWPVDSRALRSIATARVTVVTIFNPAHIFAALESRGVSVADFRPPNHLSLRYERDGKALTLEHAEYILSLVYSSLYTEQYATHVIEEILNRINVHDGIGRVDLTMTHHVFF
jgi:hypothetical protein